MSNKLLSLIFAAALVLPIGARAQVHVIPNAGTTGTATGQVAKVTGAPSTAVRVGTTDTTWNGIVVGETTTTATTGSALLAIGGQAACIFDGGTTAGDFVQISGTTAGDCHDAGATFPTSGSEVLGTVLSTNASGGTYTINVFSPGIPAAGAGGTITGLTGDVSASGSGTATATVLASQTSFCNGTDGNITGGSGTTTLTRDTCYNNVTLQSGDKLYTMGWRLYVSGTLDLSAADTGAIGITATSLAGNAAAAGNGGAATVNPPGLSVASCNGSQSGAGANGATTTGVSGTAVTALSSSIYYYGGDGHTTGAAGGAGASSGGSGIGAPANAGNLTPSHYFLTPWVGGTNGVGPVAIVAGQGGSGGSSGGGDGTHAGGGAGAGGTCGGTVFIAARTIARGTNTNAGIVSAKGGIGGNGAGGNASCTNCGGGGGGNGGGGGHIYVIYENVTGSTITNALDASSGAGGTGGTALGGSNGTGGSSGSGGAIEVLNLGSGTYTATAPGSTYNVGSGTTGGASKTAQQSL